jgi:hypothetical protein
LDDDGYVEGIVDGILVTGGLVVGNVDGIEDG